MSLPPALAPGTIIGGHYVVDSLISRGGFGAVYRGYDTSEHNRLCAIKETYDVTPSARRQALMEASVLFTVRSPHLPQVYDALEAFGRFYLVMQFIEGQTLLQILSTRVGGAVGLRDPHQAGSGPCSEQEVLSWLLPIMDVLQELHGRKPAIVHRDIKPGNIILTPQHSTVLVDFGLTKLYDPQSSTQTLVRAVSQGFSPLEQYVGKTDPRSDIYAVAATMYLLLTDCLPPVATKRGVRDELIAPRKLNPTLSPKIERALLKALSIHADHRYQSMKEFAEALQEPAFTAHSDPTIAFSPVGKQTQTHVQAQPILAAPSSSLPMVPQYPYTSPPPPFSMYAGAVGGAALPLPGSSSSQQQMYPQLPATPYRPASASQQPSIVYASLPTPFGQGCLWGMVQAVLAGILVVTMRGEIHFYLAILMGFAFYLIAGFTTTWRGGSSLRGAWAGFWAGIFSSLMFWIVLWTGMAILLIQQLQKIGRVSPDRIGQIWRSVQPTLPHLQTPSGQTPFFTFLLLVGGGLALASGLGWLGGLLGRSYHKGRKSGKKPKP